MNNHQRIIQGVALLLLAAPVMVQAQVNYAISGNTAYVTNSASAAGSIVIASTYNGYPVTSIGNNAFFDSGLTSVTIPDSVTSIGNDVFYNCSGLTNIAVAEDNPTYSSVNGVLFDKMQSTLIQFPTGLAGSYAIPSRVTSIGAYAFEACESLRSVTLPDSVTSIGVQAFEECPSLTSVTMTTGLLSIGASAFANSGLTSVTIPDSVTSIGDGAFAVCSSLTSATIGHSVTNLGEDAFYGTALTSVTIPNSVTSFGVGAFSACASLTSVTIPNGITSIGAQAFSACTALTSVTIPNSVTNLGQEAFGGCTSLTGAYFQGNAPPSPYDENTFYGDPGATVYYQYGTTGWGVTFGGAPTSLAFYPFAYTVTGGAVTITKYVETGGAVTIPATIAGLPVTSIGESAFAFTTLTSVTLPNSITNIGDGAFFLCGSLTSVTIPSGVISIGEHAFFVCSGLRSVTIPNSVTNLGIQAFCQCWSLTDIAVAVDNPAYSSVNGVVFDKTQTTLVQFPPGLGGGYAIPNSVANIGDYAFYQCTNLTSITIPNGVTNIGVLAFEDGLSLTSVTIGANVTSIGSGAFEYCSSLTSVKIPGSVTNIGDEAFAVCTSLTSAIFQGNAPPDDGTVFSADRATVYYYFGTSGWSTTYGGAPTVMLGTPAPQVDSGSIGVQSGSFGFTITGASGQTITIEASTNLVNWQPVWTNTLSGPSTHFTDAQWTNYPRRFYRISSP